MRGGELQSVLMIGSRFGFGFKVSVLISEIWVWGSGIRVEGFGFGVDLALECEAVNSSRTAAEPWRRAAFPKASTTERTREPGRERERE